MCILKFILNFKISHKTESIATLTWISSGKEYDYVIDVDIAEGRPPLKLPYNVGEDAYLSAQKFIDDNDLPQDYLDTIADFIMKNTKQEDAQQQPVDITMVDPFTGSYFKVLCKLCIYYNQIEKEKHCSP